MRIKPTKMMLEDCPAVQNMKPVKHLILIFCAFFLTFTLFLLTSNAIITFSESGGSSLLIRLFCAGIIQTSAPILFCRCVERRSFLSMGFIKKGRFAEYTSGLFAGLATFSAVIFSAVLTGNAKISVQSEISPQIPLFLIAFALQSAGEEIMTRSFFMLSLNRRIRIYPALFTSSAVFACLHIGNPDTSFLGIFNIFLFAVAAGLCLLKRGSVFAACGFHAAWNIAQGVIFGAKVSGITNIPSVFACETFGNSLLSGGGFGLEASVFSTVIFAVLILIFALLPTNKNQLPDDVQTL